MRDPLVLGGLAVAGTLAVALLDPRSSGVWPACPLLSLTGLACPLCGGLRAVHDLAHGDVAGAWGSNPLLVALVVPVVLAWLAWTVRQGRAPRDGRPTRVPPGGRGPDVTPGHGTLGATARRALGPVLLVVLLVFGVLRNVPALAGALGP
ncbi:DUF2752 domain-containing protein [Cellulomonas marina]|uniref:DUF2752 domain-containing protein n=1 Tax=Cellulomonas marina TaxID=988821 RepID=UPI000B7CA023|nr:DUF2752 domain-containing protein [Cellulomonas marina]